MIAACTAVLFPSTSAWCFTTSTLKEPSFSSSQNSTLVGPHKERESILEPLPSLPLPDRQGEEGRVFFNAWQSLTTRITEELARPIAIGTILPFPEILQRRSICYVKLVKGRVLLKTKSPTCPVGGPVGGAPVTCLLASLGARVSIPVGVRDPCKEIKILEISAWKHGFLLLPQK